MKIVHAFSIGALVTSVLMPFIASAEVEPLSTTYTTESYTYGTWSRTNPESMTMLSSKAQLVLPGLTLEQLASTSSLATPYSMLSWMAGGGLGCKGLVTEQAGKTVAYRDANGVLQFVVKGFAFYDNYASGNNHTKCVVVKFTDGEGGVWAQVLAARYKAKGNYTTTSFFSVDANGNITYKESGGNLATGYLTGGYGLWGLVTATFIPSAAPVTVWQNPDGETVLTLDDIAEHDITARMAGSSVGLASDVATAQNRYEVKDADGHLSLIRLEMQMLDDKYVKCVVLELTNASNGVAACAMGASFKSTASGGYVGMSFIKDHATYKATDKTSYVDNCLYSVATSFITSNYGLYGLTATPQPSVELVLDRSKTWTELVDGVDVSDPTVTLKLRATAADAVLTFDQAIAYDKLVVIPSGTQTNMFRVADGVSPASISLGKLTANANLTLTLPPALGASEIAVAADSTLVFAGGDETPEIVNACISGGGAVEVASGKVKFANAASTYMGGTLVKDGATAIPGAAALNPNSYLWTSVFGTIAPANLVTIEPNGLVDLAGQGNVGGYYAFSGADRIVNSGAAIGNSVNGLWGFTLTDDASLGFVNQPFHFISPYIVGLSASFALGTHTFTKRGAGTTYLWPYSGATVSGTGAFVVGEGELDVDKGNVTASSATLQVEPGATLRIGASKVTAKSVVVNGLVEFKGNGSAELAAVASGTGTVRKVGTEWTAWVSINNGSRIQYEVTGGVLGVGSCTLAQPDTGYYAFNEPGQPLKNVAVTVSGTGSYDFNGVQCPTPCCTISGKGYIGKFGALCNRGGDLLLTRQQMVSLTLADDAQVGGTEDKGSFGLLAPSYKPTRLVLDTHTMTIATVANKNFWLVNTAISGTGKIAVQSGTLYTYKNASAGNDYTLEIGEKGGLALNVALTTGSFVNRGTITGSAALTVKDTVTTTTNAIPNLVLADGATVKVTDGQTPLKVTTALTLNGTITVDADGIVPGEGGNENVVKLFDVPVATDTSSVKFTVVNLKPGVVASRAGGLPVLTRAGLMIIIH